MNTACNEYNGACLIQERFLTGAALTSSFLKMAVRDALTLAGNKHGVMERGSAHGGCPFLCDVFSLLQHLIGKAELIPFVVF